MLSAFQNIEAFSYSTIAQIEILSHLRHKYERSATHKLFRPRNTSHAKSSTTAIKKTAHGREA
jgi:hypothetical protein